MRRLFLTALGLLVFMVAACGSGSSDIVSYTDPEKTSLVNLPTGWHTYDISELNALEDVPFAEPYGGFEYPAVTSLAFDGAPPRLLANLPARPHLAAPPSPPEIAPTSPPPWHWSPPRSAPCRSEASATWNANTSTARHSVRQFFP